MGGKHGGRRSIVEAILCTLSKVQRVYSKEHHKMSTFNSTSTIFQHVRRADSKYWFGFEVAKGSIYLTSQHRTRRRKRRTSDCFFFCNSSTYLRAPICERESQHCVVKIGCGIFEEFGLEMSQTIEHSGSKSPGFAVADSRARGWSDS